MASGQHPGPVYKYKLGTGSIVSNWDGWTDRNHTVRKSMNAYHYENDAEIQLPHIDDP